MAGNALIGPTPRNPLWGTVADALSAANTYAERPGAGMPGGKANPVLSHLAQFLSLGDIAQTVDRASYGLPQTSGQGMARQLLPEARNALLAMAPNAVRNPMGAIRTVGGLSGAVDTGMANSMFRPSLEHFIVRR